MSATQFIELTWAARRVRVEYRFIDGPAHAPLMILLHEGLGSLSLWKDFPQDLCVALPCRGLVYSRPGYGGSTPRAADEHWASDFMHRQAYEVLPALLGALGIDDRAAPYWLFGHSDGASISLLHAARYPQRVRAAILLAPHIFVEPIAVDSIDKARSDYLQTDLRQRLARHHDDPDSAFWGWNDIWLAPEFRNWSIEAEVARIRCPLLLVQGRDDEFGTLAQVHGVQQLVPTAELLVLDDCGHSPHRDQPQAVIDEACAFFAKYSGDAAPAGPHTDAT